jgi:osmotically inducible protein OsmC
LRRIANVLSSSDGSFKKQVRDVHIKPSVSMSTKSNRDVETRSRAYDGMFQIWQKQDYKKDQKRRFNMAIRYSQAVWEGTLREGKGSMKIGDGAWEGLYSFSSRFEEGQGTNPEEVLGAAHAGCYSMALSGDLGRAGYKPLRIETRAAVHLEKLEKGFTIVRIDLTTEASVPDIEEAEFQEIAEGAKKNCPISRALAVPEVNLNAKLVELAARS